MAKANQFYPQAVEINQIQNSDGDTVLDVVNETVAADVIHVDEETNVETTLVDINEMHVNADLVNINVNNDDPDNPVITTTTIIDGDNQTVNADLIYTNPITNVSTTIIDASTQTITGKLEGSASEFDIEKITEGTTVTGSVVYISETSYANLNPDPPFNGVGYDPDTLYLIHEDE